MSLLILFAMVGIAILVTRPWSLAKRQDRSIHKSESTDSFARRITLPPVPPPDPARAKLDAKKADQSSYRRGRASAKKRSTFSVKSPLATLYVVLALVTYGVTQEAIPRVLYDPEQGDHGYSDTERRLGDFWTRYFPLLAGTPFGYLALQARREKQKVAQAGRDSQAKSILESLSTSDRREAQEARDAEAVLVQDALAHGRNFSLYLRWYGITKALPVGGRPTLADRVLGRETEEDFETLLANAVEAEGPLIGLGLPGEAIGAGRIESDNADWQDKIKMLADKAQAIYIVPAQTRGTSWEVAWLLSHPALLAKTYFLRPPGFPEKDWGAIRDFYWAHHQMEFPKFNLPDYEKAGIVFQVNADGALAADDVMEKGRGSPTIESLRHCLASVRRRAALPDIPHAGTSAKCPKCGESRTRPAERKRESRSEGEVCVRCGTRYTKEIELYAWHYLAMLVGGLLLAVLVAAWLYYLIVVGIMGSSRLPSSWPWHARLYHGIVNVWREKSLYEMIIEIIVSIGGVWLGTLFAFLLVNVGAAGLLERFRKPSA
jgi:hypothetical protein